MNERSASPFLLRPAAKDYLWGGERLKTDFHKPFDLTPLAETWECSVHPDGPSAADSGPFRGMGLPEILSAHPEYLGEAHRGEEFPILVKLIDAARPLSVQVHPDDAYAAAHENGSRGKTELWVILSAEPGAALVYGFSRDVTAGEVRARAENGTLEEVLRTLPVRAGDAVLVKAGTVHAIGAGIVLAEIQESSNLTYRLYDYHRRDKNGALRALHVDKALQVAELSACREEALPRREDGLVCACPWFRVRRLGPGETVLPDREDSFGVLLCTAGEAEIKSAAGTLSLDRGGCAFVPARSGELTLRAVGEVLYID